MAKRAPKSKERSKTPKKNGKKRLTTKFKPNEATLTELEQELGKIEEINSKSDKTSTKNRLKRVELVMKRNHEKKVLKGQIRRRRQETRENEGDEAVPTKKTITIDNAREHDKTYISKDDQEMVEEDQNDEFADYFRGEVEPQILLTTSIKHTGSIFKFIKELREVIPNCDFFPRNKYNLKEIIEQAKGEGYTAVIVVYERVKKPYRLMISHLPNGPTAEFKLSNIVYHEQLKNKSKMSDFNPELILKNFSTKNGHRTERIINALFPRREELKGRRVVTFHNPRDYIFFRHHHYQFNESFKRVHLAEIGPRFTMRLLSIQKGTFDNEFPEYEYFYKDKMGVKRRKFYL